MNRRQYLVAVAAGTALAGCGEDSSDGNSGDGGDGGGPDTATAQPTDTAADGVGDTPADTSTAVPADSATDAPTDTPTDPATDTPTDPATDAPTDTPTDEPTPAPTATSDGPDPMSFDGSGQEVIDDVEIEAGIAIVEGTHDGEENFQVEFVPSEGEFNELFINVIGSYDGANAALIDADTYQIDVTADGSWSLTVRQPRPNSGDSLPQSLSGEGPVVRGPFDFGGNHVAVGEYSGESNFIVEALPSEGSFGTVIFNEIGEFEGETTFSSDGVGFIDIDADGEWSLELE